MNSRMLLVNLILLVGCIYLARLVSSDFQKFLTEHNTAALKTSVPAEVEFGSAAQYLLPAPVDAPSFVHVSSRNLFLESRNLTAPQEASVTETAPTLNPKPVLIGVTKAGDRTQAVIRRPSVKPNQRSMMTLQLGDLYEGYKVTGITEKQVELTFTAANGQSVNHLILFGDRSKREVAAAPSAMTPVAPSQIIQVGTASEANALPLPGATAAVPPGSSPAAVTDQAKIPVPPAAGAPAEPAQRNVPLRRSEYIDPQGRRVMRTPWGDIVRPTETSPK